jgi:hypothetical protein
MVRSKRQQNAKREAFLAASAEQATFCRNQTYQLSAVSRLDRRGITSSGLCLTVNMQVCRLKAIHL